MLRQSATPEPEGEEERIIQTGKKKKKKHKGDCDATFQME